MEYEFTRNIFLGEYYVRCEMGYEVVARWLQEEIGTSGDKISQIKQLVQLAQQNPNQRYQYIGQEISVFFESEEVQVQEHGTGLTEDLEEDFCLYESESQSSCGLVDFAKFIDSWLEFIA
ncbi:YacL family protein [Vibrio sp. S4M6]|uniref:YacL family protein n=1 Tax=Vibrio sinus TaxID=2946865 RepID=UPI002029BD7F|nr:YacL family protein [Vibrio sinus]MCL9781066.1 YacL family protein [Vibrio sinus]